MVGSWFPCAVQWPLLAGFLFERWWLSQAVCSAARCWGLLTAVGREQFCCSCYFGCCFQPTPDPQLLDILGWWPPYTGTPLLALLPLLPLQSRLCIWLRGGWSSAWGEPDLTFTLPLHLRPVSDVLNHPVCVNFLLSRKSQIDDVGFSFFSLSLVSRVTSFGCVEYHELTVFRNSLCRWSHAC